MREARTERQHLPSSLKNRITVSSISLADSFPLPIVSITAQIDHSISFKLRTVVNQHGSMCRVGSIWRERDFRFEVGQISFATTDSQATNLTLEEQIGVIFANIPDDEMGLNWWRKSRRTDPDLFAIYEELGFIGTIHHCQVSPFPRRDGLINMESTTNRLCNRIVVVYADADPKIVRHVAADDELFSPNMHTSIKRDRDPRK